MFLDISQLSSAHHTKDLDPIVVIQHLFVRAGGKIKSVREVYGWGEAEWSEYLDKRTREEVGILFGRVLDGYAEGVDGRGEGAYCEEYVVLRGLLKELSK
jgi:hypothetical protein